MKSIFDKVSFECSKNVTRSYSTSFSSAVRMLAPSIRQDIYNIYGFVRFADEIVDTFHDYDKEFLFYNFENQLEEALKNKISLNPVLNSFQFTVHKYGIPKSLIDDFMSSMREDLTQKPGLTVEEYRKYIYGSADVVGLMCLMVFVKGDVYLYEELKESAMRLGSAFQKVNFLRDIKEDYEGLNRVYFPDTDVDQLSEECKMRIVEEIERDLSAAYIGIQKLPIEAKLGVYTAYVYYRKLLSKLKKTPSFEIKNRRIRVPDYEKLGLLAKCYFTYRFNFI